MIEALLLVTVDILTIGQAVASVVKKKQAIDVPHGVYEGEAAKIVAELRAMFRRKDVVVLNTETTGLTEESEVLEIAVLDIRRAALLDTVVMPHERSPRP